MSYSAQITIMPLKELLDPQGKAVTESLNKLGMSGVHNVRVGKHITLEIDAENEAAARSITEEACKKLLVNSVMEHYDYTLKQL